MDAGEPYAGSLRSVRGHSPFILPFFMPRASLAFACVALWLGAALCGAQEATIQDPRVGVAGHFKRGHWAETTAIVTAGRERLTGQLEVISRDGDGAAVAFVCPEEIVLEPGQSADFATLVKMGPPGSGLRWRLRTDEKLLAQLNLGDAALDGMWNARDKTWKQAHRSTALVIATLGPDAGVESALNTLSRTLGDEVAVVALESSDQLPNSLPGYDAIDCLVIAAGKEDPLAGISPQRREVLLQWVELGGRLLLVAGDSADAMLAPPSPWTSLFAGRIKARSPLTTDAGLRSFAGESAELSPAPLMWDVDVRPEYITLGESGSVGSGRPLIVEHPHGLGRVSTILIDLSQPPLNQWNGVGRLLARTISGESQASEPDAIRSGGRMTHLGYRDLIGQLRMALDQYEGVATIHFYPVAGALLLYLLLLGPGEYFLLRTAAPRAMHLTWILFPLLLIAFVGGTIALGRSSRGSAVKVNHVEILDLDLVQGTQRGTFWTGVFSPEAREFSLTAQPGIPLADAELAGVQIAWQALPGEGLGGVDAAPLGTGVPEPYLIKRGDGNTPAAIDHLPLAMASSKMFAGNWWGAIPASAEDSNQLRRGKLRDIEGTFRVVSPVPLESAFLVHGDLMYRAHGNLTPGAVIDVANLEHKHLEYFLTRRNVLKEREVAMPWNQEEIAIPRIMEVMMFHAALQGRNYTVLSHRYQGELDLSPLIRQGYAVLVGRSETPLVELQAAGGPLAEDHVRRWTYYRIIYPVAGAEQ